MGKPGEKFEFPFLMHEINVLTNWTILAVFAKIKKGGYSDLNRELTVPHTVVLPIELHPPGVYFFFFLCYYVGVIWTLNSKYQKFMTYRLVHNICLSISFYILFIKEVTNKVNPTWTDKIKNQIVLSYSCLPIPSLPFVLYIL